MARMSLLDAFEQNAVFRLWYRDEQQCQCLHSDGEGYSWSGSLTLLAPGNANGDGQLWIIPSLTHSGHAFKILNVKHGLCLCAHTRLTGTFLFCHPENGEMDQAWIPIPKPQGFFDLNNVKIGCVNPGSGSWYLEHVRTYTDMCELGIPVRSSVAQQGSASSPSSVLYQAAAASAGAALGVAAVLAAAAPRSDDRRRRVYREASPDSYARGTAMLATVAALGATAGSSLASALGQSPAQAAQAPFATPFASAQPRPGTGRPHTPSQPAQAGQGEAMRSPYPTSPPAQTGAEAESTASRRALATDEDVSPPVSPPPSTTAGIDKALDDIMASPEPLSTRRARLRNLRALLLKHAQPGEEATNCTLTKRLLVLESKLDVPCFQLLEHAGFVDQGDSFMMNGADDSTYYVLRMVDAALVSLPPEDGATAASTSASCHTTQRQLVEPRLRRSAQKGAETESTASWTALAADDEDVSPPVSPPPSTTAGIDKALDDIMASPDPLSTRRARLRNLRALLLKHAQPGEEATNCTLTKRLLVLESKLDVPCFQLLEHAGFVDQGDSFMMNGADDSTYLALAMVESALVSLPPEDEATVETTSASCHTTQRRLFETRRRRLLLHTIRFTQNSIAAHFRDGRTLQETVDKLRKGMCADELPPMRVVEYMDMAWSLDNRRLSCLKEAFPERRFADKTVLVQMEDMADPKVRDEFLRKFTTGTDVVRRPGAAKAKAKASR